MKALAPALALILALNGLALAQDLGDEWTARRGDLTPGLRYNAVTTTSTGRVIAAGPIGQIMISDDGGATFRFRTIETTSGPVRGALSDIQEYTVPGSGQKRLVAIYSWLVGAPSVDPTLTQWEFAGKTWILTSDDDGNTWTERAFPFNSAMNGARNHPGVTLHGLHVSPSGQILAFGTTSLATRFLLVWSVGGLVYRSNDAITWELAQFAYGPLNEIADANGRVVAAGSATAIDSVDGAGWSGYVLRDANITVPGGQPLGAVTVAKLRLEDITYHGGNYVAYAVTYVPFDPAGTIDSSTVDRRFTLVAANPFGPGRNWVAHEQTNYRGKLFPSTAGLLGFGSGLQRSLDGAETWSVLDATVYTPSGTVTKRSGQNLVAIGSSEEAWTSANDGASWTKPWNVAVGPDLRVAGTFGTRTFAFANNSQLWASDDNAQTWYLRAPVYGWEIVQVGNRLVMSTGSARNVRTSDDLGATWTTRTVDAVASANALHIVVTKTGRLILAVRGGDAMNKGKFFVSDDAGETWSPRSADLIFGEEPRDMMVTPSGRIIVATNTFALFNPRLRKSDDDGETWVEDLQLQTLPGLSSVTGDPSTKVIEVQNLEVSGTGRLLLHGGEAIATSDDDGDSWTVRTHTWQEGEPYRPLGIYDVVWSGGRWVALASRDGTFAPRIQFMLTSIDDGTTWREIPQPFKQANTLLQWLCRGLPGRVVASGSNASIFTTDGPVPPPAAGATLTAREGSLFEVDIPRPPVPGIVDVRYSAVQGTAVAGQHYAKTGGTLNWDAADADPQTITIQMLDDAAVNQPRTFTLQLVFDTVDVQGSSTVPVTIEDDDGGSVVGLQLRGRTGLETTEAGGQATLKVALNRLPTADVTVAVTGLDASEGTLSATSLTFTTANWNRQQDIVITGVDDPAADGNVAYTLRLKAASADTAYNALLEDFASVVNRDDEVSAGAVLDLAKGDVTDSSKAGKDVVSLSGAFPKIGASFDPKTAAGFAEFGDPASPLRFAFTAGDARWKKNKNKSWTWKSAKGATPVVVVMVDAVRGKFTIKATKLDLAATPATSFLTTLDAGGEFGSFTTGFADRGKGRFRFRK